MKPSGYVAVLLLGALAYGCATTRSNLIDTSARQAKPEDYHIRIYNAASIQRPYKVIGVVIASTGLRYDFQDAVAHLQAEARKMGGDALTDLARGLPEGAAMPTGGWFIFGSAGNIWSAKVIVWE